jgi:hypothetical protein
LSTVEEEKVEETPIKGIESEEPKPKYSERIETLVGYDDCGACIKAESFINGDLKTNSDVPVTYKKIIADSEEGKRIVAEKKLSVVPFVEECLIPTDPNAKPECHEMKSFKKSNFKLKVNT